MPECELGNLPRPGCRVLAPCTDSPCEQKTCIGAGASLWAGIFWTHLNQPSLEGTTSSRLPHVKCASLTGLAGPSATTPPPHQLMPHSQADVLDPEFQNRV